MKNAKDETMAIRKGSFCWRIRNGNTIMFWEDIWCGDCPLRVVFPRLFHLAIDKNGTVKEYLNANGFKEVNRADFFVRPLLDRELDVLNSLKEVVKSKELAFEEEDCLI